jgi:hypothetical protein
MLAHAPGVYLARRATRGRASGSSRSRLIAAGSAPIPVRRPLRG